MNGRMARKLRESKPRPSDQGLTHALSFSTAEGLALYEGLVVLSVFMARPGYADTKTRPYGLDLVTELRDRLVKAAPELQSFANAADASAEIPRHGTPG